MIGIRRPIVGIVTALVAAGIYVPMPRAAGSESASETWPLAGSAEEILNPPLAKLKPRRVATSDQRDRATAIRLFTEARLLFHRNQLDAALKKYQRASRIHPDGTAIAREVVPLATELNRFDMGARYALIAADQPPADPLLIYRLALAMAISNQEEDAKRLYEIAVEHDRGEIPEPIALLAALELGHLYYLDSQFDLAAQALLGVDQALQAPADYGLDEELQRMLRADPNSTYALLFDCYLKTGLVDDAAAALERANRVSERPMQLFRTAQLLAAQQKRPAAIAKLNEYLKTKSTAGGTAPYNLLVELLQDQDRRAPDDPRHTVDSGAPPRDTPRATGGASGNLSANILARLEELHEADPENVALAVFVAQQYLRPDQPNAKQLIRAEKLLQPFVSKIAPVEVYQGLLQVFLARADWRSVLGILEKWIVSFGALDALDDELLNQLRQDESRAALRAIVDAPHHDATIEARVVLGQLALRADDHPTAARLLQSAYDDGHESVVVFLLDAGIQLLIADRFDLATPLLRKVLGTQSLEGPSWIASYYLAGSLEMQGRTDEALAVIDAATADTPANPLLLGRKAWILDHARRTAQASKLYQQIIDRFADDYSSSEIRETVRDARSSLSNLRVKNARLTEAEELLQQVLDEYPRDPGAMNDLGYLWADQDKLLDRARRLVEKAVRAEPENGAYHDSLGWVHFRMGNHGTAIEHLEKAASLEKPDPVILEHLGDALQALDRKADAIHAWRQALSLYAQQENEDGRAGIEKKITQYAAE